MMHSPWLDKSMTLDGIGLFIKDQTWFSEAKHGLNT
jgi:hypothetical protein